MAYNHPLHYEGMGMGMSMPINLGMGMGMPMPLGMPMPMSYPIATPIPVPVANPVPIGVPIPASAPVYRHGHGHGGYGMTAPPLQPVYQVRPSPSRSSSSPCHSFCVKLLDRAPHHTISTTLNTYPRHPQPTL